MILLALILSTPALATNRTPNNDADARADADSGSYSDSESNSRADSDSSSYSRGGDGGDASIGDVGTGDIDAGDTEVTNTTNNTTNSSHNFLALSLMFPNASGCFKGVQGGGSEHDTRGGVAAFLGIHLLDKNCWADKLASTERDADINARLKCGAKWYRNAVAFDSKRKDRHQACYDRVYASNLAMIDKEKAMIEDMLRDELALQTNAINEHTSAEANGTRRAVETCTDCYGEKAK